MRKSFPALGISLLAAMVCGSAAQAKAAPAPALKPGTYQGLLDMPGNTSVVTLQLTNTGGQWQAMLGSTEAVANGGKMHPAAVKVQSGEISLDVGEPQHPAFCRAAIAQDRVRPLGDTCRLELVRVQSTGLAGRASGAWRDASGRLYAIAPLADFPQPMWIDYQTGAWRYLYEHDGHLQAGPGVALPNPVAIDLKLSGPTLELRRDGRSTRLTRVGFAEVPMTWTRSGATLQGTLILPPGKGRHPAIVLTQMSAPAPRDAYRTQAYFFAAHGIASLIYDRRGVGESTGDGQAAGMHDLADDAVAAVHALQRRGDIDARRIGTWGHSQGGWIAPIAAARSPDVAFVIAQSGPAVSPAEQEIFRVATTARNSGLSDAEVKAAQDYETLLMRWVKTAEGRDEIIRLSRENRSARWARFVELRDDLPLTPSPRSRTFWHFDPLPDLREVRVPMLLIYGDRDGFVPVDRSLSLIRDTVAASGSRTQVSVLHDAAHGLWSGPVDSFHFGATSPGLHPNLWPTLLTWLRAQGLASDTAAAQPNGSGTSTAASSD